MKVLIAEDETIIRLDLRALLERAGHEVVAATRTQAVHWADQAVRALEPLPDGPVKRALVDFTEALVHRTA